MTCAWVAGYTKHSCWCLQTAWPHTSIQHVVWRWWETAEIPAEEQKKETSSSSQLLSKNKLINMLNTDSKIHSLELMFWGGWEGTICPQQSFVKGKMSVEGMEGVRSWKYIYIFALGVGDTKRQWLQKNTSHWHFQMSLPQFSRASRPERLEK